MKRVTASKERIIQKIKQMECEIAVLKDLFDKSNLPDSVDEKFCHELILKLRK